MQRCLSILILSVSLVLIFFTSAEISNSLAVEISPFSMQTIRSVSPQTKIDKIFYASQDYKLDIPLKLVSLGLSGSVNLENEESYARVILKDKENNEYLIYEANYLLAPKNFQFTDVCEETCVLNFVVPDSLEIELSGASLNIATLKYETDFKQLAENARKKGIETTRKELKSLQEEEKIKKMNEEIRRRNQKWIAGKTSVSQLSYQEKKRMFGGKVPNLYGFEYYVGGIFEIPSTQISSGTQMSSSSSLPSSFDWRNRHGENNPDSPYYPNGWLTPVKDQADTPYCWAFSAIGAVEAMINLYYNQHLDIVLSEQQLVSCTSPKYWSIEGALEYIKELGVVKESCFPYNYTGITPCENIKERCPDWESDTWRISSFSEFEASNEEVIKRILIEKGPLPISFYFPCCFYNETSQKWECGLCHHAVVLIGYGVIQVGEEVYNGLYEEPIKITPSDTNYIGKTYWLIKNSWGNTWGEHGSGYGKVLIPLDRWVNSYFVDTPIPPPGQSYEIKCVDNDKDGYCNWGISEARPSTCPSSCDDRKDCDDSCSISLEPFSKDPHCLYFKSLGDVNKDCIVNIMDIALVAKFFGRSFWNVFPGDVNHDCEVNQTDFDFCVNVKNKLENFIRSGLSKEEAWNELNDEEKRCDIAEPYMEVDVYDFVSISKTIDINTLYWNADMNNDCKVDIKDIFVSAKQFGKTYK
jgi:C1A family cysteine protease